MKMSVVEKWISRAGHRSHAGDELIEQDHRNLKAPVNVVLGFKRFGTAATTISGIELMHRLRKGQFNRMKLHLKDTAAPSVWTAVLSAR
jgi:transposase-like protein